MTRERFTVRSVKDFPADLVSLSIAGKMMELKIIPSGKRAVLVDGAGYLKRYLSENQVLDP